MIFRHVRMSPERFNHLADLLRPLITKEVRCRIPISVEERLAVTLRYLATGNSQRDLAFYNQPNYYRSVNIFVGCFIGICQSPFFT